MLPLLTSEEMNDKENCVCQNFLNIQELFIVQLWLKLISKLWEKLFSILFFLTLCRTSFTKITQMNEEKKPMLKVRQKALEVATVFSSCV